MGTTGTATSTTDTSTTPLSIAVEVTEMAGGSLVTPLVWALCGAVAGSCVIVVALVAVGWSCGWYGQSRANDSPPARPQINDIEARGEELPRIGMNGRHGTSPQTAVNHG